MKSKVDKLDVDKSIPVLVDLSKESDVVKMMLLKKDVYYCKKWNIEDEISDITILATNTILNSKINKLNKKIQSITNLTTTAALDTTINEVNDKIPSISNLAATIALNTAENKKPNVINLDKKTDSNIKTNEIKKKDTEQDNDKYITTPEFNKLTAEPARLAQENLGNKNAIANFVKKDRFWW